MAMHDLSPLTKEKQLVYNISGECCMTVFVSKIVTSRHKTLPYLYSPKVP